MQGRWGITHPRAGIRGCDDGGNAYSTGSLEDGTVLHGDHVILATGYRVDVSRVPYLVAGNILKDMQVVEGFPVLDESFQASVSNLYCTGFLATRDFGPFFGFVVGCCPAARIIINDIKGYSRQT